VDKAIHLVNKFVRFTYLTQQSGKRMAAMQIFIELALVFDF